MIHINKLQFINLVKNVVIDLTYLSLRLALWVKFSADNILKYFSYFSKKTGYDISCKLETICMKCQILFFGKNKKNIINLSSAENAQRVVKVKDGKKLASSCIIFSFSQL